MAPRLPRAPLPGHAVPDYPAVPGGSAPSGTCATHSPGSRPHASGALSSRAWGCTRGRPAPAVADARPAARRYAVEGVAPRMRVPVSTGSRPRAESALAPSDLLCWEVLYELRSRDLEPRRHLRYDREAFSVRGQVFGCRVPVGWWKIGLLLTVAPGVAEQVEDRTHKEATGPRLEPRRVAQRGQLVPRHQLDERVLDHVLEVVGELGIAPAAEAEASARKAPRTDSRRGSGGTEYADRRMVTTTAGGSAIGRPGRVLAGGEGAGGVSTREKDSLRQRGAGVPVHGSARSTAPRPSWLATCRICPEALSDICLRGVGDVRVCRIDAGWTPS